MLTQERAREGGQGASGEAELPHEASWGRQVTGKAVPLLQVGTKGLSHLQPPRSTEEGGLVWGWASPVPEGGHSPCAGPCGLVWGSLLTATRDGVTNRVPAPLTSHNQSPRKVPSGPFGTHTREADSSSEQLPSPTPGSDRLPPELPS